MKTYWLEHRDHRPPLSRVLPPVSITDVPELEWERSADAVLNIVERNADMQNCGGVNVGVGVGVGGVQQQHQPQQQQQQQQQPQQQMAEERVRTYSPVTFQEVARHSSVFRSPARHHCRGTCRDEFGSIDDDGFRI